MSDHPYLFDRYNDQYFVNMSKSGDKSPAYNITLDTPRNTNNRFDTPRYITRFKDIIGYNSTNKHTNHNSTTGVKLIHRLLKRVT
ncbi:MAG: hypothetical protein MJK04_18985 [Psychrosphaera sp.]|nr:hypothetical protein [Psychrosphaera sp.]